MAHKNIPSALRLTYNTGYPEILFSDIANTKLFINNLKMKRIISTIIEKSKCFKIKKTKKKDSKTFSFFTRSNIYTNFSYDIMRFNLVYYRLPSKGIQAFYSPFSPQKSKKRIQKKILK